LFVNGLRRFPDLLGCLVYLEGRAIGPFNARSIERAILDTFDFESTAHDAGHYAPSCFCPMAITHKTPLGAARCSAKAKREQPSWRFCNPAYAVRSAIAGKS
jgi:hypothetical protein